MDNSTNSTSSGIVQIISGDAGSAQSKQGITSKAFALNLAIGLGLFAFELTGFFLLKSSDIGRRIYQPKTYLAQERLRVEAVPKSPLRWIQRIFTIKGEELRIKCGLDGYFLIRFIRALIIIFVPLMAIIVTTLLPINYNGGKDNHLFLINGHNRTYNVTGLDTLSWQNVAPTQTHRYWAHLLCALLVIGWTLWRIYREKLHFIHVRQQFLTSPEHRLRASARTVLVTNIPSQYRSKEGLLALYDVFVDDDDQSRLKVWMNRDYGPLRALVASRRKLCHALEKEELRILRLVNKKRRKNGDIEAVEMPLQKTNTEASPLGDQTEADRAQAYQDIYAAFEADCREEEQKWYKYLKRSKETQVTIIEDNGGDLNPASKLKFWSRVPKRKVPKIFWLRARIARLTVQIEEMLRNLDDETRFPRQNSAFIQFDRQMSAHMACSLVSHHRPGVMAPRFLDVAPHEVLWRNMGVTSLQRFVRSCIAFFLFLLMIFLWGLPTTFLGFLSQLDSLRSSTSWLTWLQRWPSWIISLISGPLTSILLALLVQLVVPALCRKLAVLVGSPTRGKREVVTQDFYFAFLFIELVLVTSISSGIVATIPAIIANPSTIPTTLATDLPKAANYFFNYLIIQALGFSGSVLFQYLRLLFIVVIWPWFTQTPREEAWLQTIIPHQMWGNVFPLITNFAAIGLIYSIIAPLMLIFISGTGILFWVAYRHNYYYVQRNKVDTHGLLFQNALSHLYAGIYVMEITLIGLFFLVRNSENNVACTPQAIIMIVVLVFTAAFHYALESKLRPLYEFLPVTLEDTAADAERERFLGRSDSVDTEGQDEQDDKAQHEQEEGAKLSDVSSSSEKPESSATADADGHVDTQLVKGLSSGSQRKGMAVTAANARKRLWRLRKQTSARLADAQAHMARRSDISRRAELADQLGAAIASYPDELTELTVQERNGELAVAYQDPVTREPAPVIWLPRDQAGISDDVVKRVSTRYGRYLQYSNSGAFLSKANKCEITQPAPDTRPDWLLDWVL